MYVSTSKTALIPMVSPIAKQEILTLKELAKHLKVNERTIYRLASSKKIPAFKVGGTSLGARATSKPSRSVWAYPAITSVVIAVSALCRTRSKPIRAMSARSSHN